MDTITDGFGNQILYEYGRQLVAESSFDYQCPWNGGTCYITTYYFNSRVAIIKYNFADRVTTLPPAHNVARLPGSHASEITFTYDDMDQRLDEIKVYNGQNLDPIKRYVLNRSTLTHANNNNGNTCKVAHFGTLKYWPTSTAVISSIRIDGNANGGWKSLPLITFSYSYHHHFEQNGTACFYYAYLTNVQNGYGANFNIEYQRDGRQQGTLNNCDGVPGPCSASLPDVGFSHLVKKTIVNSGRDVPLTTEYSYPDGYCYDQVNPVGGSNYHRCHQPETDSPIGGLGGAQTVLVAYKSGSTVVRREKHRFFAYYSDTNPQAHALYGKQDYVEAGTDNGGSLNVLQRTQWTYHDNLDFRYDSTSTFVRFMPVEEVVTQQYASHGSSKKLTSKMRYEYNPAAQHVDMGSGQYQIGRVTEIQAYDSADATQPYRKTRRYYSVNDSDGTANNNYDTWIIAQTSENQLDGANNLLSGTLYHYDAHTYHINEADTLNPIRVRQFIPIPCNQFENTDGMVGSPTGCAFALKTIDTTNGYDVYGNLTSATTYNKYGFEAYNSTYSTRIANTFAEDYVNGVQPRVTSVTYDTSYNLYPITVANAVGDVTQFEVYGFGGISSYTNGGSSGMRQPAGLLRQVKQPLDSSGNNHLYSMYEYDPFGRLSATYSGVSTNEIATARGTATEPFDGTPDVRYRYWDNTWNDSSNIWLDPAANQPFRISTEVSPNTTIGQETVAYTDGLGRGIQTQQRNHSIAGQTLPRDIVASTAYDVLGNVVCTATPYSKTAAGGLTFNGFATTLCNNAASRTTSVYDWQGRPTAQTTPDGRTTLTNYAIMNRADADAFVSNTYAPIPTNEYFSLTAVVDANNHIATHQWVDARGNLRYVAEHSGVTGSLTVQAVTQYTYDVRGQLVAVEDELGNTTSLTYDKFGRKTAMTDPDMGTWLYTYDVSGNMIMQTDANGNQLCFLYDAQNRLTAKATGSGSCPTGVLPTTDSAFLASYSYDTATNGLGQLASSTWRRSGTLTDSESFTYDSRGRLATHTRNIDGRSYSQTVQAYDTLNRPTQVVYPGGQTVTIGYDREGEETLTVGSTALVNAMKYNERGQLTLIDRAGSAPDATFSYHDAANNFRLQAISTAGRFVQNNFTYDAVGNISGFNRKIGSDAQETLTFTYDELNRLTRAESTGNSAVAFDDSFAYSRIGNLSSFAGTAQSYTSGTTRPHAVLSAGGKSYTYDNNGNLTQVLGGGTTRTLTWNAENRLASVTESGQTTQFRYDPAGIRTTVINPDGSKLLQPFPHYEEERSAGGTLLKRRTSYTLGGQLIALEQDGVIRFANTDHLGSPAILMSTSGGNITSTIARYKPYGGYLTEPSATALDRGYTGHDRTAADDDLDLIYMNARYLDSSTGRFISADTLVPEPADPQSFNRYSYVFNNAINLTDPSGHCPWCITAAAGAATDMAGQMLLNYFFDPNVGSFEDAWNSINWGQVAWSALEGLIMPGGRLGSAVAGAAGEVAVNAATAWWNGTSYTAQQALADFAFGFVANLAGEAIGDLVNRYGDNAARAGFDRLERMTGVNPGCAINSFTTETLVATADGLQPISDIDIGDLVLAYDEVSGITDYYPVTWVWEHAGDTLAVLELEGETIEATLAHPFYVEATGWVDAGALRPGMAVRQADGTSGLVTAITFEASAEVVYNLTVAGAHTFFVGDGAWLVHNCGGNVIYQSLHADGTTEYVGRTSNFLRRQREHSGTRIVSEMPGLDNLSTQEARDVEEALIVQHGLVREGGSLSNRRHEISPTRPEYQQRLSNGRRLLRESGY